MSNYWRTEIPPMPTLPTSRGRDRVANIAHGHDCTGVPRHVHVKRCLFLLKSFQFNALYLSVPNPNELPEPATESLNERSKRAAGDRDDGPLCCNAAPTRRRLYVGIVFVAHGGHADRVGTIHAWLGLFNGPSGRCCQSHRTPGNLVRGGTGPRSESAECTRIEQMRPRRIGLERLAEILCFPDHLSLAEFHDAHGLKRRTVIVDHQFGDPQVAATGDPLTAKRFSLGCTVLLS